MLNDPERFAAGRFGGAGFENSGNDSRSRSDRRGEPVRGWHRVISHRVPAQQRRHRRLPEVESAQRRDHPVPLLALT